MNRPVSFELHIKPLFSDAQRDCMLDSFDLRKNEDVKSWSVRIGNVLADKTMPADETNPWPDEWIALFKRWIAEGCQP